ncbi:MAG: N-6 DNA methylase [Armatimonadota bacterium]
MPHIDSPEQMLEAAYQDLGFANNRNLVATSESPSKCISPDDWLEQGEWLSTAKLANAEKIFFVDGNPVVVFAKHDDNTPSALRRMINCIWCMARPRLLFLALPGELRVFDLAKPPISINEETNFLQSNRVLKHVKGIQNVQKSLQAYNLEQIQSGKLFEEERFQKTDNRADEALIRDLRTLRAKLMDVSSKGLFELKHAHALIGRSIFIRYLEDRNIILPEHFAEIAAKCPEWQLILNKPYEKSTIEPGMEQKLYPKVLNNKNYTYALFDWLAAEFNGDMFPRDPIEEQAVTPEHLDLLRRFLLGDVEDQSKLFFYAYNFEVIPIELISSIYEEFYTTEIGQEADKGTQYTPSALVEFILSKVLTPTRLEKNPRIIDPACGSGIFLVEAFRRIVRYRVSRQNGKRLSADELRDILQKQIIGIEINPEAVRVAAFSLYLALLHYQDPSSIRAYPQLPNLIYDKKIPASHNRYDILLCANTFDLDLDLEKRVSSVDIVVGNPPWGFPKKKKDQDDKIYKKSVDVANTALTWCKDKSLEVGDNELSQAFIHRALDLLKDGGTAGLLLSSGVLLKSHRKTQKFREQWLNKSKLEHVVNFIHARNVFFSNAIAPFISAVFTKQLAQELNTFEYWSAKKTALVARLRAPILSRVDLRLLNQDKVLKWDAMWKIHWWGNHRDEALIRKLQLEKTLDEIKINGKKFIQYSGRGYQDCPKEERQISSDVIKDYKELWTEDLQRYGPLNTKKSRVRDKVHSLGKLDKEKKPILYDGIRLLFSRGIRGGKKDNAGIVVRLALEPFCFRNSIDAFRITDGLEQEAKVLLAICRSSLVRYYLFLTAGSWGTWHDDLQLNEQLRKLPIRLPQDDASRNRIIKLIDKLQSIEEFEGEITGKIDEIELALDEAIFDLYELTEAERDLVRDMCITGFNLFYKNVTSEAIRPVNLGEEKKKRYGVIADLPSLCKKSVTISAYLRAFLRIWNQELEPDGEFRWQVIYPNNSPMIMVVFSTQYKDSPLHPPEEIHEVELMNTLQNLGKSAIQHYGSKGIYTDSLIRSVSPTRIIIIKRNEQRLWTRSMAREDAEATLLQAMQQSDTAEDIE